MNVNDTAEGNNSITGRWGIQVAEKNGIFTTPTLIKYFLVYRHHFGGDLNNQYTNSLHNRVIFVSHNDTVCISSIDFRSQYCRLNILSYILNCVLGLRFMYVCYFDKHIPKCTSSCQIS